MAMVFDEYASIKVDLSPVFYCERSPGLAICHPPMSVAFDCLVFASKKSSFHQKRVADNKIHFIECRSQYFCGLVMCLSHYFY